MSPRPTLYGDVAPSLGGVATFFGFHDRTDQAFDIHSAGELRTKRVVSAFSPA
jgi:hypothetical protein